MGCKSSHEAWKCLQECLASVSIVRVNQLKTELHTALKGGEYVDKFLMRLKGTGSNSQGFQRYEHGESSNTQRSQDGFNGDQSGTNFQGGTSFLGNGNGNGNNIKSFQGQQAGSFNNRRFGNGNGNSKFSSGFNNRNGNNNYSGNGKSV
ncbi:hypothetical protein C1H46_016811 [Malus baccata]|uniref:Uncharacterized protein n=1 Tax=Malus baccata TaxID=106549 RepID=A0A540MFP3_MALBA|nr:hypothetical protein C1H46_016811 [Malus baccata]